MANEIVCKPVFVSREYPHNDKINCFVIMPFKIPTLEDVYRSTVKPNIESLGINCVRGDDIFSVRSIIEDVWSAICQSNFVIGEFTGRNPNVMYEAGIAHTLGKPLICITQNLDDVPFDLRHLRLIVYESTPSGYQRLAESVKRTVESLLNEKLPEYPSIYEPPGHEIERMRAELIDMHNRNAGLLTGIEERIVRQHFFYHNAIKSLKPALTTKRKKELLSTFEFCKIPEGKVNTDFFSEEENTVVRIGSENIESFYISKFPITNKQYKVFLDETGHPCPETWIEDKIPEGLENHPAIGASWVDVLSFCSWFSDLSGKSVEIPTEAHWLRASGYGDDQRRYPWGNAWSPQFCNSKELGVGTPTPVDMFDGKNVSPYGCVDMLGNVWEWTTSPHNFQGRSDFTWRAVRGGANYNNLRGVGVLARLWANPGHFLYVRDLTFRVIYPA